MTSIDELRRRYQRSLMEARDGLARAEATANEARLMIYRLQGALTALDELTAADEGGEKERTHGAISVG